MIILKDIRDTKIICSIAFLKIDYIYRDCANKVCIGWTTCFAHAQGHAKPSRGLISAVVFGKYFCCEFLFILVIIKSD